EASSLLCASLTRDGDPVRFSPLSKPSTCPALGVSCVEEIRTENGTGTGSSLKEFCGESAELQTFSCWTTHFLYSLGRVAALSTSHRREGLLSTLKGIRTRAIDDFPVDTKH